MVSNVEARITFCNFAPPTSATKFYSCYKKEVCCVEGCCINGPYHIYQVWYYWFIFLIIFGIISGGSWLCKKPRPVQLQQARTRPHSSHPNNGLARCNRRRCSRNFNNDSSNEPRPSTCEEDIILDRLFVSFRNRNALVDPPSYSSIIPRDYSSVQPKLCPLYSYYGPPPTYSSAAKSPNDSPTQRQEQLCPTGDVSSITQIQIHSEESANQVARNSSTVEIPCSSTTANSVNVNEEEPIASTSAQNHISEIA